MKKLIAIPLIAFALLLFGLSAHAANPSYQTFTNPPYFMNLAVSNTILVSMNGNDASGLRGNWHRPFRNIDAAASNSLAGMTIVVMPGTYTNLNALYLSSNVNYHFIGKSTVIFTNTDFVFTDSGTAAGVFDVRVEAPYTTFYSSNGGFLDTSQASGATRRTFHIQAEMVWANSDTVLMFGNALTNIFKMRRLVSQNGSGGTVVFTGSGTGHFEAHATSIEAHTTDNGDALIMFNNNYARFINCRLIATGTDTINIFQGHADFFDTDIINTFDGANTIIQEQGRIAIYGGTVYGASASSTEVVDLNSNARFSAYGTVFTNATANGYVISASGTTPNVQLFGCRINSGASGTDITANTGTFAVTGTAYDPAKAFGSIIRLDNIFPNDFYGKSLTVTNGYFQKTNSVNTGTWSAGRAYSTNITGGNITLGAFADVPTDSAWAITGMATNGSGVTGTITMPAGVVNNADGTAPAVVYITNNTTRVFQVMGFGRSFTNLLSP